MSEVERFNEYTWGVTEDEHGEYVRYADYDALAAEAQALREEVAALRARVVVVSDGYALVPVEPTREMFIAINKENDKAYAGGCHHGAQFEWLWAAAIEAAPRPNGLTVSEGLLRRLCEPLLSHADYVVARNELRALLNEDKENGNG
ncbi:hypothetical protein ACEOIK_06575 [Pseudomonas aeruginosa]|uniref:hypothetical protein n=1 Tax=Pseudomonas aeruginosa TaxID=287 RepID=UPI000CDB10CC|nr:hypothetical protein [Pseudomonas aeruginosa]POP55708.1 hypothetical protein C3L32_29775 [Pseudomonas aeruginosa]